MPTNVTGLLAMSGPCVTDGYLDAMGERLVRGRGFNVYSHPARVDLEP